MSKLQPQVQPVKTPPPPSAADPLSALIDAAAARAVDAALERISALQTAPRAEVLCEEDVCALLQVSRPTLHRLRGDGLPFALLGCVRRYVRADVIAWVRAQLPTARPQTTEADSAEYERETREVLG